ncbi:MAG: hypothetical protein GY944_02520 [bacterium]|nr:hypothetical protein [bacterium]
MSPGVPRDITSALPEERREIVERLRQGARGMGLTLYWVGGPVRDWLLGRPVDDIDLLVAGGGDGALETLARKVGGQGVKLRQHTRFSTLSFDIEGTRIDLACMRRESYPHAGALPRVEAGTLDEDLRRRDFTVNALAVALFDHEDGDGDDVEGVIDLVEGRSDLEAGVLRVLHPRSFHDDPTRALRAARLAARLGFKLVRGSRTGLRDALRDGAFGAVSGERLRREFEKLFADSRRGGQPAVALERLSAWHVLPALEPGLELAPKAKPPLRRLGKLLAEPPWRPRDHRPWVAGLHLWLAPLPPALRKRTVARLSVRGDTAERIVDFARTRGRCIKALEGTRGRGAVDTVLSQLDEEQLFALCASCDARLRRRIVRWAAEDRERRIPVTGRDLVAAKIQGKTVGVALARIRAGYLDGEVANREEALALAREIDRRSRSQRKSRSS